VKVSIPLHNKLWSTLETSFMELDKFEDGIPEEIRNCKKEVKNEDTN